MLRRLLAMCCGLAMLNAVVAAAGGHSDDFSGPLRGDIWDVRNPDAPNAMAPGGEWLSLSAAAADPLFPWDRAGSNPPMLLMEPTRDDAFTLETRMRVVRPGGRGWGSLAGLAIFRKDRMALGVWGVRDVHRVTLHEYDLKRIWSPLRIDIEAADDPSAGVWLQISKADDEYTFRYRFDAEGEWAERTTWRAGNPFARHLSSGDYLVGLIAIGGAQEHEVEFDYFHSPELGVLGVDAAGKLPLAWADLRVR